MKKRFRTLDPGMYIQGDPGKSKRSTSYHGSNRDALSHRTSFWNDLPEILFFSTLPWVMFFEFTATGIALISHYVIPTVEIGTMAQLIYSVLAIPLGYFINSYISLALERYQSGGRRFHVILSYVKALTGKVVAAIEHKSTLTDKEVQTLQRLRKLLGALGHAIREKFAHPVRGDVTPSRLNIAADTTLFPDQRAIYVSEMPQVLLHKLNSEIAAFTRLPALEGYGGVYFLNSAPTSIEETISEIEANELVTVPPVYSNFLFVLIFIYLLLLPFFIPASVHWWIALIVQPVATYLLMGMYILGSSMREPFESRSVNPFSHTDTHGQAARVEEQVEMHIGGLIAKRKQAQPLDVPV